MSATGANGSGEPQKSELVVVLHGAWGATPDDMADVRAAVSAARPDAEVIVPRLPGLSAKYAPVSPEAVAVHVAELIDAKWNGRPEGYERILLVGHSAGGMIARKVVVLAHGEMTSPEAPSQVAAPFEAEFEKFRNERPWAQRIERVVLLAGITRGMTVASAKDWFTGLQWTIGSTIAEWIRIFTGRYPTIMEFRRGSPFMVQTRLQWLALNRRKAAPNLLNVQLVGTIDDFVPISEAIDFDIDLRDDAKFRLIETPQTTHINAPEMKPPGAPGHGDKSPPVVRWRCFVSALKDTPEELAGNAIAREHLADTLPSPPDVDVKDVVFVIHGIRDKGYWTQKIARQIKIYANKAGRPVRSMTGSYGYLAMLPFVLPWVRRRKVDWLMDRYTEVKSQFPVAEISYVGHSNGTYLVAGALQDYPAARFKRIAFAGSVVRRDYDWAKLCNKSVGRPNEPPRVQQVLNYVATADWIVAVFPKGLEPFRRWIHLGSAGHSGFDQCRSKATDAVHEIRYVRGGHGAGIQESQWDEIADFIINGEVPLEQNLEQNPDYVKGQNLWVRYVFGPLAPILVALLLLFVLALGAALVAAAICSPLPGFGENACTSFPQPWTMLGWLAALTIYLWLVSVLVSRV